MKETKVYVDELPIQCIDCQFAYSGKCQLNGEIYCIENCRRSDCPLIDIKTHDRELVKEVCEKIKTFVRENTYICGGNATRDDIITSSSYNQALRDVLDFMQTLQKEIENEDNQN